MISIVGNKSLIFPTLPNGSANPLFPLITYCSVVGLKFVVNGDEARVDGISDLSVFTLERLAGVVSFGAEVYGFPAWIAIPVANIADDVPEFVPNATDDRGTPRTWEDWHSATHRHIDAGETIYVDSASFGTELPGSVIVSLLSAGFTIKTLEQMREMVRGLATPD